MQWNAGRLTTHPLPIQLASHSFAARRPACVTRAFTDLAGRRPAGGLLVTGVFIMKRSRLVSCSVTERGGCIYVDTGGDLTIEDGVSPIPCIPCIPSVHPLQPLDPTWPLVDPLHFYISYPTN